MSHGEISLENLGGGVLLERFREELEKVIENILDPNTDAKAKRTIALAVTFKPAKERSTASVEVAAQSKLAPVTSYATRAFIGRQGGQVMAFEDNPNQLTIDGFVQANTQNVQPLKPAAQPAAPIIATAPNSAEVSS